MPRLAIAESVHLNRIDPSGQLFALMKKYEDAINNIAAQANANPAAPQASAPPQISSVNASVLAPGILHLQVQDNNPVTRGIWYHYEISTTPDFQIGTVIHAGATPSRDLLVNVGAGAVYARAYSQYLTSPPSSPVPAPAAVDPGGGTRTGSVSGAGSGTEPSLQPQPGAGFGNTPSRLPRF